MSEFVMTMRLTYLSTVTIEADSPEEADDKARAGEFADEGMGGAELVDWDKAGPLQEVA